ncbi:capsular polysaccharide synthesis protein [Roseivivax sp. CAU 1753]
MDDTFNRNIFGYWHQGRDAAPDDIKRCWDLWARMNPGWDLRILDWTHIAPDFETFGIDGDKMSYTGISNIVRLSSLAKEGGVWVDAYTVPLQPLDTFLPRLMPSGFFAYHDPYRKRMAETWFLGSVPDHPLVVGWRDKMVEYWRIPRRPMRFKRELDRGTKGDILRLLGRTMDKLQGPLSIRGPKRIYQPKDPNWAVDVKRGGGGIVTPYFACAMLFDLMMAESATLWAEWEKIPKTTSYDTLFLRHWKKDYAKLGDTAVRMMAEGTVMQKLSLPTKLPERHMAVLEAVAETAMPGPPAP